MYCQTLVQCGGANNAQCVTTCQTQFSHLRSEYTDAFFACFDGQCAKTADQCSTEASGMLTVRTIDTDYLQACLARRTACSNSFIDDYCSSGLLNESSVADAQSCLTLSCDQIAACLRTAFGG